MCNSVFLVSWLRLYTGICIAYFDYFLGYVCIVLPGIRCTLLFLYYYLVALLSTSIGDITETSY